MTDLATRLHKFLAYYKIASRHKNAWFSMKWRVFVVLLVMAYMLIINDYLNAKYLAEIVSSPGDFLQASVVVGKVFYWFFVGIISGAFAAWLIFEGEYAIGVYHTAVRVERELINKIKTDSGYSPNRSRVPKGDAVAKGKKGSKKP